MTRETKVGLVVAGSFICLVAVVVAAKFHAADPSPAAQAAAEPAPQTPTDDKDKAGKKKDEHKPAGPSDRSSSVTPAQHQEHLAIPAVKSDPVQPFAVPPSFADIPAPANLGALPPPPTGEGDKGPKDPAQEKRISDPKEQRALADAKNADSTPSGTPPAQLTSMNDGPGSLPPPPSLPDKVLAPPPFTPAPQLSDKDKILAPPPFTPAPQLSDKDKVLAPPLFTPAPQHSDKDKGGLTTPPPPLPNTAQIPLNDPGTGNDVSLPPPPPPPVSMEPQSNPAAPPPPPLGADFGPNVSKIAPTVQLPPAPGGNSSSLGGPAPLPGSMPSPPPLGALPGSATPGSFAPALATPVPATGADPQGNTRPIGAVSTDANVSATPVTPSGSDSTIAPLGATTLPLGRKTPRPGDAMPLVTESAIHPHICGADETRFADVSKKVFNDEKYGPALARFNSELPAKLVPGPGKTVLVPSREFLEKNFPSTFVTTVPPLGLQPAMAVDQGLSTVAAKPLEKPFPTAPTLSPATTPPLGAAPSLGGIAKQIPLEIFSRANTGPIGEKDAKLPTKSAGRSVGPKEYHVAAEGENILDIAAKTLGDSGRWPEIYRLNGGINPTYPIQGGTTLRLPPSAVVSR